MVLTQTYHTMFSWVPYKMLNYVVRSKRLKVGLQRLLDGFSESCISLLSSRLLRLTEAW